MECGMECDGTVELMEVSLKVSCLPYCSRETADQPME